MGVENCVHFPIAPDGAFLFGALITAVRSPQLVARVNVTSRIARTKQHRLLSTSVIDMAGVRDVRIVLIGRTVELRHLTNMTDIVRRASSASFQMILEARLFTNTQKRFEFEISLMSILRDLSTTSRFTLIIVIAHIDVELTIAS